MTLYTSNYCSKDVVKNEKMEAVLRKTYVRINLPFIYNNLIENQTINLIIFATGYSHSLPLLFIL